MGNILDAMKLLGLESRAHLEWVSASEGPKFQTVTEFVEQIRALGPNVRFGMRRNRRKIVVSRAAAGGVVVRFLFFRGGCLSVYRGCVFAGLWRLVGTSTTVINCGHLWPMGVACWRV